MTVRSSFLSWKANAPREDFLKGVAWEDGLREITPGVRGEWMESWGRRLGKQK